MNRKEKIIVATMPKSGTYLIANILKEMSIIDCEMHLSEYQYSDYRNLTPEEKIANVVDLTIHEPLEVAITKVMPGQFVVGHIPYTLEIDGLFGDFSKIISVRHPRSALVSAMRFEERRIRANPNWLSGSRDWVEISCRFEKMEAFLRQLGGGYMSEFKYSTLWMDAYPSNVVQFEKITGMHGYDNQVLEFKRILDIVNCNHVLISDIIEKSLWMPTPTYSGSISNVDECWNDNCEEIFEHLGGIELTEKLGYEPNLNI
ncbi:MAG: hypothetical protein Q7J26_03235 [Brevundimonas sp.]|uniref:hypothetical protein n=1 Tax=Brevundimonas sp. TaxID=1871086 RepID=UPI0027275C79|nr:hypothetical protein [Brevundimonas sp.]MDO9607515.1 hypothetical protein [Brevundimonas sp.]